VTNVSRGGRTVNSSEAIEISGLLAELIRSGQAVRGAGSGPLDGDSGPGAAQGRAPGAGEAAESGEAAAVARVSPHVIRAAVFIHENGPQTVGQLARGLGISQGWASRIVDDLERAGYVSRTRDPADRRVVRVGLTAMATERVQKAARWRGDAVEAALSGMGPDERAAVALFLRRFLERTDPTR
jgi:DNA-binding MarR family transcriptional regulator